MRPAVPWSVMKQWLRPVLAVLAMTGVALLLYHALLFPADPAKVTPWSSDGWGHLMKAEYLLEQIQAGVWYPDIFPGWYQGMELLRYYAPIPYYALAAVTGIAGNIFTAGNWFLFLCALFGGLSFLLYRNRIGIVAAAAGGILFMILPDNIRVAFAEGNIPRVVATALLPMTFYFLLNVLQRHGRRCDIIGLAIMVMVMTLSHAMMSAIFLVCMGLFSIIYWFSAHTGPRVFGKALLGMITGVMLSFWWLLPSLVGGVTEVDQQNSSEALARFPMNVSLNPFVRLDDKEIFYIGLSLVLGLLAIFWFRKKLTPMIKSLGIIGLITVLLSSTVFSGIYDAIPFSYLFRPLRFLSFAGFALLLAVVAFLGWFFREHRPRRRHVNKIVATLLLLLLLLDFWPSLGLVYAREAPEDLVSVAEEMKNNEGWREATLDLSRLGSAPSYFYTAVSEREQVFGWAYQGSATVALTSSINLALEEDYDVYTIDRLNRLGVDDIVLYRDTMMSSTLGEALVEEGFEKVEASGRVDYYHRDGQPRAYALNYELLGIGDGAYNLAIMFPQMELGQSPYVDDYSLEFLCQFKRLLLSRFKYHDKEVAEALITAYAVQGGWPVIDLTGSPEDVLAKEPFFLGVYGEPVNVLYQAMLVHNGEILPLLPFRVDYLPWNSFTPQGLDVEIDIFPYAGVYGVARGFKLVEGARVDFIGLNLPFHAVLTHDPVAIQILEEELGLTSCQISEHNYIALEEYTAGQEGYTFTFTVPEALDVVVPVAYHEGFTLEIDGQITPITAMNNLVAFAAPAGTHRVALVPGTTFMHTIGLAGTTVALVVVCGIIMWPYLPRRRKNIVPVEEHHDETA